MEFLNIVFMLGVIFLISYFISVVMLSIMSASNITEEHKFYPLIPAITISIIILFFTVKEKVRDEKIQDYINSANSITELKETLEEKEIFTDL